MLNLFSAIPESLSQELTETLIQAAAVRVERILSHGHVSPPGYWYDQEEQEFVVLLQGAARLRFENDELLEMRTGDAINIPAHRKHRVDWTPPNEITIWLAIFYR